mgnify:CR=1 FL=1
MDYAKESLKMHYELRGKLEMTSRAAVDTKDALSLAYTPGVAAPCLEIQKDIVHNSLAVNISRNKLLHFIDDRVCFISVGSIRSVREILQCPERCARLGNSGAHITATFGFCCNLCIGQIYNVFNVIAEVLERDTAGR